MCHKLERMREDQLDLIIEKSPTVTHTPAHVAAYIAFSVFPVFIFMIAHDSSSYYPFLFITIFQALDLFICNYILSYPLVGLSWRLHFTSNIDEIITYQIEPDPFVAKPLVSNIFWILRIFPTVFWLIAAIFLLFKNKIFQAIFTLMVMGIYIKNFQLYFKCNMISQMQSTEAVRDLLIQNDDPEEFLEARKYEEEESQNEKIEEESKPPIEDKPIPINQEENIEVINSSDVNPEEDQY